MVFTVFKARGLNGEMSFPHPTVEAAGRYRLRTVSAQLSFQKSVHLVGYFFGGWVAFELAPRYNVPGHRRARVESAGAWRR